MLGGWEAHLFDDSARSLKHGNSIADGTLARAGESVLPSSPIPLLLGSDVERPESNGASAAVAVSAAGAIALADSGDTNRTVSGNAVADLRRMLNDRADALRRAEINAASARIELAVVIASWDRRLDVLAGDIASARAGLAEVESRVLAAEKAAAGNHA